VAVASINERCRKKDEVIVKFSSPFFLFKEKTSVGEILIIFIDNPLSLSLSLTERREKSKRRSLEDALGVFILCW